MIRFRIALLSLALAGGAVPVRAQQRDSARTDLDVVVITAARREQRLKDAVVPTEVISRAEIARSGATDVAALLQRAVGVQLDGGVGGGQGVQLLGMDSRRVLVLLDGQPVIGRVNGDFDLSRLPLAGVDRIEVVKGPQGTLYGSEALGGVINIITRSPRGAATGEAQVIGGSRERIEATAGGRASIGRLRFAGDASARHSDLAVGIPGELGARSERATLSPTIEYAASDALSLRTGGLLSSQSQRYRSGQLYRFVDDEQLGARVDGEWKRGTTRITPVLHLSRFDHLSRASTAPQPVAGSGDRDVQSLAEFELTGGALVGSVLLDAGVEARRERITADRIPGGARALDAVEGFTQLTLAKGPVTFEPGVRVVRHSQFGDFAAPKLALLVRVNDAFAIRASAARGFRAPDFKELYLSFANPSAGYAVEGNPDLKPERSASLQVGLEWSGARGWWRVNAFDNEFRDFIATGAQDASGTFTYENIERGLTRGAESEAAMLFGRWRAEIGYAYLEARDGDGAPLPSRPMHSGRAAIGAPLPAGGSIDATWIVTGRTLTTLGTGTAPASWRGTFERLDLRASMPVGARLRTIGGVENLLDRRLGADWPGFTGRRVYAGLEWRAR